MKNTICRLKKRFMSISTSMIVSFVLLICIIVFFISAVSYNYTKKDFERISINYTQMLISDINKGLNCYVNNIKSMADTIIENKDIKNLMSFYSDNDINLLTIEQKQQLNELERRSTSHLFTFKNTRNDITNIAVISKYGHVLLSDFYKKTNLYSQYHLTDWYKKCISNECSIIISPSHVQNFIMDEYKWVISISKPITNSITGEVTGVILIDLNYQSIKDLCKNNLLNDKGYIYIIDKNKNYIYHPQQQLIYSGIKTELTDEILNFKDSYFRDKINNKIYIKNCSDITGWNAIGVINSTQLIKSSKKTTYFFILIAVTSFLFATFAAILISNAITRPIKQLEQTMHKVENGNLDVKSDIKLNNEIGNLSNTFNAMILKTKQLMKKTVAIEEEKRKSEIYALQAQINPHFLYNTLDTIIWMSASGKNEEVTEITSALAQLFRTSINKSGSLVTLSNEIENIKSYLTIQKQRYEDKLTYSIDIDKELKNLMIPKLILQPIVENSIYHGLKIKPNGGNIYISASSEQEKLILTIKDNGVGMTQEQINTIFSQKITSSQSIGINNVNNRIKLSFGDEYGIHYQSEPDKGTVAQICLPIIKEGEHINE